jgi:hypothetical protein
VAKKQGMSKTNEAAAEQNKRMLEWFKRITGMENALLCEHMARVEDILDLTNPIVTMKPHLIKSLKAADKLIKHLNTMETPAQKMMGFILENFEKELEANVELDEKLDMFWDKIQDEETTAFKEFFFEGAQFTNRKNAFGQTQHLYFEDSFKQVMYKLYPEQ